MKKVAFIPIKLNNERFKGKNLKKFDDGKPLINLIQEKLVALKEQGIIDEIYVYCSDEMIKDYLMDGVDFLKRPLFLDQKETKGTDIYSEFLKEIDSDVYILAHATSPFIHETNIAKCIEMVEKYNFDSAFCAKKIQNFLWADGKPMNFILNDPPRTQDMKPIFIEQSTPYVFKKETFQRYNARTGVKPYICECSEVECIDIDYPEDFLLANIIYMNHLNRKV
jgi:CMP-N-acetylneuraminic acid synthetase